jgi:osmotically-inducible protein OsmY
MKRAVCVAVLLLAGCCFGQVRESASASADGIAPVFPSAQTSLAQMSHPQAQSSWDLTTPEVERLIEEGLSSESALTNAKIDAKTNDSAVVLTGAVGSDKQRDLASEVARAYAGSRQIENQIKVGAL